MTWRNSNDVAERLMTWASDCASPKAKSLVGELADVYVSAQKAINLIDSLRPEMTAEEQARILGGLEVWLFDELYDRLTTLKPRLERVTVDLSDIAG
jgi:hypothetical protein